MAAGNLKEPWLIWLIAEVAASLTALAIIYKYVWRPFKKKVIDKIIKFYNDVEYISDELRPHGGSSLRDHVDLIYSGMAKIDQRQWNFFHFDPQGIVETDSKGNLIWANRAYLEMVDSQPASVYGQGWRNFIAENDRERITKEWKSAVDDNRDFYSRLSLVNNRGELIKVEARCLAMRGPDSKLIGHLGFIIRMDIPPPGCRWCRDVELLSDEVANLLKERKDTLELMEEKAHREGFSRNLIIEAAAEKARKMVMDVADDIARKAAKDAAEQTRRSVPPGLEKIGGLRNPAPAKD